MTKKDYLECLKRFQEFEDCETFFSWLLEEPSFMDLTPMEIEINFMIRSIADISFLKGVVLGVARNRV